MTETQQTPIIKGSWEDLLLQAQQLAARQDDGAIDIYRKSIDRLSRLPANQRQAAEGRLQNVMRQAAVDLQYYLSYRDRYEEALAVNEKIRAATRLTPNRKPSYATPPPSASRPARSTRRWPICALSPPPATNSTHGATHSLLPWTSSATTMPSRPCKAPKVGSTATIATH